MNLNFPIYKMNELLGENEHFAPLNDHEKTLRNVLLVVNYASQVFTTFSWQLHFAYVYPHTLDGTGRTLAVKNALTIIHNERAAINIQRNHFSDFVGLWCNVKNEYMGKYTTCMFALVLY